MRIGMKPTSTPPAARVEGLLVERLDDEAVVYDLETKQAHCLKPLAAVVFAHCDGKTTVGDIAVLAAQQLDEKVDASEVADAVAQLDELGLLDAPLVILNGAGSGVSRREMLRKAGYTGAVAAAAPLITSIAAPTAAMAQSGQIPSGCGGCGKNPDCESNHCCQSNAGKQCQQGCCVADNNSCHFCDCVGATCTCTVAASDIPGGKCPCLCSDAGCTGVCCTSSVCCTPTPAC